MRGRPGLIGPLILLAIGFILLFNNLGYISWDIWTVLWRFWPVILILLGLEILVSQTGSSLAYALVALVGLVAIAGVIALAWMGVGAQPWEGAVTIEEVSRPLGTIREAQVEVNFSGGDLSIGSYSGDDKLMTGRLGGPVGSRAVQRYREENGRAILELDSPPLRRWVFWPLTRDRRAWRWELSLTTRVPLTLRVNAGAGRTELDLRDLEVRELDFNGGVGETIIRSPRSGQTIARVDGGVGAITIEIPSTMPARIQVDKGLGQLNVAGRFERRGDDTYETPGFSRAESYLDLEVDLGVGSVTVR